jgi:hypothetical protein
MLTTEVRTLELNDEAVWSQWRCHRLNFGFPKDIFKSKITIYMNVTLFRNRIFED